MWRKLCWGAATFASLGVLGSEKSKCVLGAMGWSAMDDTERM